MAGGPAPVSRSLGQRDRCAALVRAPWLRGGTAADTASVHRPRPGPAGSSGRQPAGGRPPRILARQLVVKAARRMRREGHISPSGSRCRSTVFDAPRWTAAAVVAAANDDRAGLEALTGLWAALVEARPQVTLFRLTVSFDRFRPADAVQLTLPWHAPDDRSRVVRADHGRRRPQQPLWTHPHRLRSVRRSWRLRWAPRSPTGAFPT